VQQRFLTKLPGGRSQGSGRAEPSFRADGGGWGRASGRAGSSFWADRAKLPGGRGQVSWRIGTNFWAEGANKFLGWPRQDDKTLEPSSRARASKFPGQRSQASRRMAGGATFPGRRIQAGWRSQASRQMASGAKFPGCPKGSRSFHSLASS
jgi:hypothetical protein